jgi:transposase-like protein
VRAEFSSAHARPYSYDLRTKAIEAVKRGERKSTVCRMLKISRNTLNLWLQRKEETETTKRSRASKKGLDTKLLIGRALRRLRISMGERPKVRWLRCGGTM